MKRRQTAAFPSEDSESACTLSEQTYPDRKRHSILLPLHLNPQEWDPQRTPCSSKINHAFSRGPWTPSGEVFLGVPTLPERNLYLQLESLKTCVNGMSGSQSPFNLSKEFRTGEDLQGNGNSLALQQQCAQRIQRVWRTYRIRQRRHHQAALKLQAAWKSVVGRRRFLLLRKRVVFLQRLVRSKQLRRLQQVQLLQETAALRLQAFIRQRKERKRFLHFKQNVLFIQRWYRQLLKMSLDLSKLEENQQEKNELVVEQASIKDGREESSAGVLSVAESSEENVQQLEMLEVKAADLECIQDDHSADPMMTTHPCDLRLISSLQFYARRFLLRQRKHQEQTDFLKPSVAVSSASKIPKPCFQVQPRLETPTALKQLQPVQKPKSKSPDKKENDPFYQPPSSKSPDASERRSSIRLLSKGKTRSCASSDDIAEKKRRLEAIRAEKDRLRALLESQRQNQTTQSTSEENEAPAVVSSQQPSRDLVTQVILPKISLLSDRELRQLTEANTQTNGTYTRPVMLEVVHKEGPKPPSPNSKTLATFARTARLQNATPGKWASDPTVLEKTKIQWSIHEQMAIEKSSPSRAKLKPPGKSCFKSQRSTEKSDLQLSASPIVVQRIVYQAPKPTRRLTGIPKKKATASSGPQAHRKVKK